MDNLEQPDTPDSELPDPADSDQHTPDTAGSLEGEGAEGDDPPEEEDEIEVDGRKFVLPKSAAEKIRAGFMKDADYTQKTQGLSAEREAVKAEREAVARERETHQQFIKEMAKVEALNDQLAAYDKLDWQALIAENPQDAMLYQEQRRQLEAARNAANEAVTQKQQQFAVDEQQAIAKQIHDAEAYVQREIPGWNPERQSKVRDFVASQGVKLDQNFARVMVQNPALMKLLDKAEKYDQLAQKQAAKPPAPPAPPPATRVTAARQGAAKDPAKMSTDEWMAHRTAQLNRKR